MQQVLEFEKPVIELREKIEELKTMTKDSEIDLSDEISKMEERLTRLENDIYGKLKPWDRVQIARHVDRPTTLDYIEQLFTNFIEFHGDRLYGDDPAIVAGIAKYKERPVTVIGHQRGENTKENLKRNFGMAHPEGYRKALRHMKQAEKFNRPIITFIDTKGAFPGKAAEERGQSEAIARNLMEMAGLTVPIICIVIGEGGSGGALALGVGDRIHMLENSTYSVISPEGAAALLWKDSTQAERAAKSLKITAPDLKELGIIDEVIPEPLGGAHRDKVTQALNISRVLDESLQELEGVTSSSLLDKRWEKYKNIGEVSHLIEV
ncbi:acetyl-coenzyme A carboxyl transferase alpha chain [Gracilibacillus boraciitolerans JCM 21714]|uniref:Acetyl-coenzyme A carboxylase carboxyl transferase subunit alpha n=1 Tax=Gracilibacillus boraciitolerans JCM 21714 TaxID=1298598 RepID=W4VJJ8_9BACI|nr:acetyl-CoA carboxylase carboxyl transferase subunit alpha [Gracilibacillus boraciitolerans]GAE92983.1 acetyl-coenzyme A carboxyl transferase alpha chain [Gracilibacillus boraciitolerans JCM 21714]